MKTIVVLTRNARLYTSRRLVQAIRGAGHRAWVVDPFFCTLSMDPFEIRFKNRKLGRVDAVIPRIGSQGLGVVMAVLRQFEGVGVRLLNAPTAIEVARDKLRTYQVLSLRGLPIPPTIYTTDPRVIERFVGSYGGRCIIKVLDGLQGSGVMLAESTASAMGLVDWLTSTRTDFVVQAYVADTGASDVRCLVLDGQVIASMRRQGKAGEFRSNLHRGGEAFPVTLTDGEQRVAIAAANALGLRLAGVDVLRSAGGPLILEVNASPGLEGIEGISSVDLATQIVTCLL